MDILSILVPIAHAAEEAATAEHASGGVLGTLGIDGKLLIAQLVNFGIILFVLWKWVFTPVAKNLTARTEKIEKSLHDADRITKEKEEFEAWKTAAMATARKEAEEIISQAGSEAEKTKQEISQQTREEQTRLVDQAKKQIEDEKNLALKNAKAELASLVVSASEKILRGKLDEKKDAELIKESLKSI